MRVVRKTQDCNSKYDSTKMLPAPQHRGDKLPVTGSASLGGYSTLNSRSKALLPAFPHSEEAETPKLGLLPL